jgi:hypothetical protein
MMTIANSTALFLALSLGLCLGLFAATAATTGSPLSILGTVLTAEHHAAGLIAAGRDNATACGTSLLSHNQSPSINLRLLAYICSNSLLLARSELPESPENDKFARFLKLILVRFAGWAHPLIGQFFESGSRPDIMLRISELGS